MAFNRRKLLAVGGLSAVGLGTGLQGPETRIGAQGLTIHIFRADMGWMVAVPDWPEHGDDPMRYPMPVKGMPLNEFLKALDGEETA